AFETAKEALATIFSVANIYFWYGAGYFDADSYTKPLLHMWSLGVEEQFYLIWPLALFLITKAGSTSRIILIVFSIILGTILAYFYLPKDPSAVFFLLPFRISEFAIGAFLAASPKL